MTYAVRRIMHLGVSDDRNNAFKVVQNMIINLEKEKFSLDEHKKSLETVHKLLGDAEKDGETHLNLTKILTDVKLASVMSYKIWESLNHSLHTSTTDDMIGARKNLKYA